MTQFHFRLVEEIYPDFYYHTIWDRMQSECPDELPVELIDLTTWLQNRNFDDEEASTTRKKVLAGSCITALGIFLAIGLVWLINDNYKF
jgi:hypothetical protein